MRDTILVTGGAGFIGSNFIRRWLLTENAGVVNLDQLTYAGNTANLESVRNHERYLLRPGKHCDQELVRSLFANHSPRALLHFAAESHVDRSILGPAAFIRTDIEGTFKLLEESKRYFESLQDDEKRQFRFLQVSTDEVHGSLGPDDPPFCEQTPYAPNSPYSASKASGDHLVRVYYHTYGLPTLTVNCSNNYGPFQFPEKLIPLMIVNALNGKPLPIYGDGSNRRDWLYVIITATPFKRSWQRAVQGRNTILAVSKKNPILRWSTQSARFWRSFAPQKLVTLRSSDA